MQEALLTHWRVESGLDTPPQTVDKFLQTTVKKINTNIDAVSSSDEESVYLPSPPSRSENNLKTRDTFESHGENHQSVKVNGVGNLIHGYRIVKAHY